MVWEAWKPDTIKIPMTFCLGGVCPLRTDWRRRPRTEFVGYPCDPYAGAFATFRRMYKAFHQNQSFAHAMCAMMRILYMYSVLSVSKRFQFANKSNSFSVWQKP